MPLLHIWVKNKTSQPHLSLTGKRYWAEKMHDKPSAGRAAWIPATHCTASCSNRGKAAKVTSPMAIELHCLFGASLLVNQIPKSCAGCFRNDFKHHCGLGFNNSETRRGNPCIFLSPEAALCKIRALTE